MKRPEFLKVHTDDIARVGEAGACLLALIRYATAPGDEKHGRVRIDGEIWWRASYADIAELLGVDRDHVRRVVRRLGPELLSSPGPDVDRTKAYRVPLSSHYAETPHPTSHYAETPQGCGENATGGVAETPHALPITELVTEETEPPSLRSGGRAGARETHPPTREEQGLHPLPENQWIEPPVHCPLHPDDTTRPCIACKIQREEWEEWQETYDDRVEQFYREHPEFAPKEEIVDAEIVDEDDPWFEPGRLFGRQP